jgi:hypothetical protein
MAHSKNNERRSQHRYNYLATVDYAVDPRGDELYKGVIVDISTVGLCLYVFSDHTEGQEIRIKTALPIPLTTAKLCWTAKEDEGFYRSGFSFV